MMNWIISNWYIVIGAIALIFSGGYFIYKFLKLPTKEQIAKIKEWLIFACIEAEKEFGSKTGQIKLRYVYDKFITKFAGISALISFEYFCVLVDQALETVKKLLDTNPAIANLVKGGDTFESEKVVSNQ